MPVSPRPGTVFLTATFVWLLGALWYTSDAGIDLPPEAILLGGAVLLLAGATGPLLLAARQWVAGGVLTVAGVVVVVVLARALHQLARRWLVFVPAGVVLHDPLGLVEPVLLIRAHVRSFAAALSNFCRQ